MLYSSPPPDSIEIGMEFTVPDTYIADEVTDSIIDMGYRVKCIGIHDSVRKYRVVGTWSEVCVE